MRRSRYGRVSVQPPAGGGKSRGPSGRGLTEQAWPTKSDFDTALHPGLFLCPPPPGGGGGVGSDPMPSQRRMVVERRARSHSKDLDKTVPKHFLKFKIEVTCQAKVRSKVKIGCIQVADLWDLKRSIFRPKQDQANVPTKDFFIFSSGQGQGQVKKTSPNQSLQMSRLACMFHGPFWTKN